MRAHTAVGVCLVDCNAPEQMVKELGAVAFPLAACDVKEAVGMSDCAVMHVGNRVADRKTDRPSFPLLRSTRVRTHRP